MSIEAEKVILQVHITEIKEGDTVIFEGKEKTVCEKDITHDYFMGMCIFGNNYRSGHKLVETVVFPRFYKGKLLEGKKINNGRK